MGLDMYMFHINKPSDDEAAEQIGKHTSEVCKLYNYIDKETFDADPAMFIDLLPFVQQITVIESIFNQERCFRDHGVDILAELTARYSSMNGAAWFFADGTKLEISQSECESYIEDVPIEVYIWKSQEVAYWRKADDLNDYIQVVRALTRTKKMRDEGKEPTEEDLRSWETANCGYYLLSPEEKAAIKKYLEDMDEELFYGIDNNASIVYHAWW
jgi:hypothetical protein